MKTTATIFDSASSVARIRLEFHDQPVGEALRGAAYGERLKSKGVSMAIGIVAAVAVAWTGVGLLAAGTLLSQVAGGAMIAGGVLSGVGAVTGNKKLTRAGAVLSLAGGIGGVAAGIGGSMGGINAAGSGSDAITTFATNTAGATPAFEAAAASNTASSAAASPTIGVGDVAGGATTPAADVGASATVNAANPTIGLEAGGPDMTGAIQGSYSTAGAAPAGAAGSTTTGLGTGNVMITEPAGAAPASTGFGGSLSKAGDAVMDFGKTEGGGKIIGGILQGAAQGAMAPQPAGLSAEQNAAAASTANVNNTQADILKQQQANLQGQVVLLDPNDPNFEAKRAAAVAAGKSVSVLPKYSAPTIRPVLGSAAGPSAASRGA